MRGKRDDASRAGAGPRRAQVAGFDCRELQTCAGRVVIGNRGTRAAGAGATDTGGPQQDFAGEKRGAPLKANYRTATGSAGAICARGIQTNPRAFGAVLSRYL